MASESRNNRKKRRVKMNLSRARRALQAQTQARIQAHATLLMVLSQAGGEVEVSHATMQTVLQGMQLLNWVTEPKKDDLGAVVPGSFIVRVVTQEGVQAVVDEAVAAANVVAEMADGSTVTYGGNERDALTITPIEEPLATPAEVEAGFAAVDAVV